MGMEGLGWRDVGMCLVIDLEGVGVLDGGEVKKWDWREEWSGEEIGKGEGEFVGEIKKVEEKGGGVDIGMFGVERGMGKD